MKKENLKSKKGITLIALIITIIVMMILVGVTVVTISDGGLFEKTKTGVAKTEEEAMRETMMEAMILKPNGKINTTETANAIETVLRQQGKNVSELEIFDDSASFEVTGSDGKTNTFKITENNIEKVTTPWITRGLTPNWTFGKWYVTEEGNGALFLGEDGSYAQDRRDGIVHLEMTTDEIQQLINQGTLIFSEKEVIAVNQLKLVLNSNGTVTLHNYDSATGEYVETNYVYTVEQ